MEEISKHTSKEIPQLPIKSTSALLGQEIKIATCSLLKQNSICYYFCFTNSCPQQESVLSLLLPPIRDSLPSLSCLPAKMSAPTIVPTPSKQTATARKCISLYLARRMNHDKAISTGIPKQSRSCVYRKMVWVRNPPQIWTATSWKQMHRILLLVIRC